MTKNNILFFCPYWGSENLPLPIFIDKVKMCGYDGIEINIVSFNQTEMELLLELVIKYNLKLITQVAGIEKQNFTEYKDAYIYNIDRQININPYFINCHTGSDFFSFEQNSELINIANNKSEESGVKIIHETHRSRFNFAPSITAEFLKLNSTLRLAADFSHWCVVSESLLENHGQAISLAISRSDHIHSRVGHAQGPQVSDPRLPEWKNELDAHLQWWDAIVKEHQKNNTVLTITTEFGPPNYMPTIPFTNQPVANQWEINIFMKNLLKTRYCNND